MSIVFGSHVSPCESIVTAPLPFLKVVGLDN